MDTKKHTLVLREFERFVIGERWDAAAKTISHDDASRIAMFQSDGGNLLFELGYNSGRATQWVGTLGLGDRSIEVVPKIDQSDGDAAEARTRENLLCMISRSGMVPVSPGDIARMANSGSPILSSFLELYVDNLTREWRRGAVRQYRTLEDNRACLKGKLLFQEQLRRNLVQKQRFYSRSDEFTEDNVVSRLLKAALRFCCFQRACDEVSRKAKGLLLDFDEVADYAFSVEEAEAVQIDRQIIRFEPLIHLARLILRAFSPSSAENGKGTYALMFDMNRVFEAYIAAELRRALSDTGCVVSAQIGGRTLLRKGEKGAFNLRPDIGVFQGNETVCLLDTKWKRLDMTKPHAGVAQSDMYQMYAYGKEFRSPLTVLVYPRHGTLSWDVARYEHNRTTAENHPTPAITVRTVDITSPMTSMEHRRELMRNLYDAVFKQ